MSLRELGRDLLLAGVLLFALSAPASADDCSGPDDCARVVGGSSVLAVLLALLLAAAPAAKKPWKTKKDKRKFTDCAEARSFVETAGQTAEADPHHTPTVRERAPAQRPDGSWEASATVTWAPDADISTMTLPEWSWPTMTPAQEAALKAFTDAIVVHERGHFAEADRVARDVGATLTGTGEDAAAARADLQQKLEQHRDNVATKLREASDAYDAVTNHGATQSQGPSKGYPGGKDAVLNCP